jgi:hypothetical protein
VVNIRGRCKPLRDQKPGEGWRDTGERFIDPETGAKVAVWIEPKTGERMYVRD